MIDKRSSVNCGETSKVMGNFASDYFPFSAKIKLCQPG